MSEQKLGVITKSIDLLEYTMKVTSNRKRYPNKYVALIKRIQNKSMDIYECLMDANSKNLAENKMKRQELQTEAISCCNKLSCYIELSMTLNLIGSNTAEYWQGKINDVKYMAIAWRSSETKRK